MYKGKEASVNTPVFQVNVLLTKVVALTYTAPQTSFSDRWGGTETDAPDSLASAGHENAREGQPTLFTQAFTEGSHAGSHAGYYR